MTPSKILFFLCLSFIIGIFLESLVKIPQIFIWGILIFAILLVIIFMTLLIRSYQQSHSFDLFVIAEFCLMFLALGILRMQISEFNIMNDKLSKLNGKGQIVLNGIISNEPDIRDTFQKLKVKINEDTVLITAKRYPEYKYLDKIKITGKLETPSVTDEFNYKNYLMKDHIYSVMNFPKISALGGTASGGEKINPTVVQKLYSGILFFKQKIRESIRSNFSPPQSSILEGTILGDNGAMTNELKTKLNITGLRHIIAVSGTHVVILSLIIMSLFLFLGFHRSQAFYFVITFICLYIVITGFPSSGIRAGIMGGIFLLAEKLGRQGSVVRIITLAGAVMLALNPLLLLYDVGFQLSFLAVIGLIYIEPLIKLFFKFAAKLFFNFNIKKKSENLLSMVSTTLAAQAFTLPIMVYNFGNISYVSPITNFLVAPIVSPLMILGFLSSIVGVFSNILGQIFPFPCYVLLIYFVKIIDFFSQSWAMGVVKNVSWIWLVASYLIISSVTYFLRKKYFQKFL